MAAFKQFLASDVIVSPLELSKGFEFPLDQWKTGSDGQIVGINRFEGITGSFLDDQSTTFPLGNSDTQYKVLVYDSIKELYYSNFLTSSTGISPLTASLIPGEDTAGNRLVGPTSSQGRYENYSQTDLNPARYIGDSIGVLSIPSKLYGESIVPGSFTLKYTSSVESGSREVTVTDDGEGRIVQGSFPVGNIIYSHGIVIFTDLSASQAIGSTGSAGYGRSIYGTGSFYYGQVNGFRTQGFLTSTNITCSFSSSYVVYETQYKATARESEFNFSLNPTIISGSDGTVYNFATSSDFSPYITTIGLYDENQYLLAVGKLSQPYALSATTDMSFIVNIDR